VGTVVWLASELMFFSGLFAAYFTLRASSHGPWPPEGTDLNARVAGLFTLFLVASSGTIQLAVRAIAQGDRRRFRGWLMVTISLALVFLANQAREWVQADFSASSHTFGSAFYVLTGFHGLHVLGGVVAMFFFVGRAMSQRFGARENDVAAAEVVSYYWHFVDVVWIGLYATLFLLR
jgi:cytochrome c oxidase subunit 3